MSETAAKMAEGSFTPELIAEMECYLDNREGK